MVMLSQLVLAYADGRPRLTEKRRDISASWTEYERPEVGVFVPRLGSQDLVRFAAFASAVGVAVEGFEIADSKVRRLDAELERSLSDELVATLREAGQSAALRELDGDFRDYTVVGVKLVDRELRAVTLRRRGVVDGEEHSAVIALLADAWDELKLS